MRWRFLSLKVLEQYIFIVNSYLYVEEQQASSSADYLVVSSWHYHVTYYAMECMKNQPSGFYQIQVPCQLNIQNPKPSLPENEVVDLSVPNLNFLQLLILSFRTPGVVSERYI